MMIGFAAGFMRGCPVERCQGLMGFDCKRNPGTASGWHALGGKFNWGSGSDISCGRACEDAYFGHVLPACTIQAGVKGPMGRMRFQRFFPHSAFSELPVFNGLLELPGSMECRLWHCWADCNLRVQLAAKYAQWGRSSPSSPLKQPGVSASRDLNVLHKGCEFSAVSCMACCLERLFQPALG